MSDVILKYGFDNKQLQQKPIINTDKQLFIGTPAYNSMVHTDYLHSIIDFYKNGLPVTVMTIGNESLIPRGRNTVISYFYHMTDFTHLVFLDADIFLDYAGLSKLLTHNVDVIGAPVALKGFTSDGKSVYNVGNPLEQLKEDLVSVDKVGTAVFILSRKAVESLVKDAIDNNEIYDPNPHTRGSSSQSNGIDTHYNIFSTGVKNREYDSEDFYVCRKLIELGYKIHIDPTVRVKHNGMFYFI